MPAAKGRTDLTRVSLPAINGQPVLTVAEATLKSGAAMVAAWDALEPIVRTLTVKVDAYTQRDEVQGKDAAKLLEQCATVLHKVGAAASNMLRASEGLSKLYVLVDAGRMQRAQPTAMTQKQLAATVIETCRTIKRESGACPVCTETIDACVQ